MRIRQVEIRKLLLNKWPNLSTKIWPFADSMYWLMDSKLKLKSLLDGFVDKEKYVILKTDCDDFTLALHCYLKSVDNGSSFSYAAGEVLVSRGHKQFHACNIVLSQQRGSEVLFVEPQTNEIWVPTEDNKVYFVRM